MSVNPLAGMLLLVPHNAAGRSVTANWDTLGMRATRSDLLILEDCRVPDTAVLFLADDARRFRHDYLNWFWGSYTAVYLGIAVAAFHELRRMVHARQPQGYAQPVAYHPDVRRHIAELSADLEAARLITYRSAWLSDTQGPTAETTAALYRAKYSVGEAVEPDHPGGAHARWSARHLQRIAPRAVVPRWCDRSHPATAGRLLLMEHGIWTNSDWSRRMCCRR